MKKLSKHQLAFLFLALFLFIGIGLVYSGFKRTHFAYGQTILGTNVGWMQLDGAYKVLSEVQEPITVTIETQGQTKSFTAPERFPISKEFLANNLNASSIQISENPRFREKIAELVQNLGLNEDAGANAYMQFTDQEGYVIVPEIPSTMIDKAALSEHIYQQLSTNPQDLHVDASDFYIPVEIPSTHVGLNAQVAQANEKIDKEIVLHIRDDEFTIPRQTLASVVDENGNIKTEELSMWVNGELNLQFSTMGQPIRWRNPHTNKLYEYQNNGAFGFSIDTNDTFNQIVDALNSGNKRTDITVGIIGNPDADPNNIKDFIYINLLDQKMYVYRNGEQKLETWVITGRNNRGTATVPGFHTIGYKELGTTLRGTMLDGTKYAVPVTYWMPLLSHGPYYTGIGIHDSNNKEAGFGNPLAWTTYLGSNGCINTPPAIMPQVWELSFAGMPVIIQGDLYADSPGAYDKPVDFGTEIQE